MTQQTLEILYREHHSWLWQWIKSRLDCDDQASDLTQETFIKLLVQNRAEDLRAPKAYLSSIARGLLVDVFRRRSVEKAYLDALALQPEQYAISPELQHSILETLMEIDQMLDSMSERGRQIFLMAQLDGLSYVEISRRLDISVNTVRKHFIRAMTQCLLSVDE
ncbi:sigma-70 family RNA polymerase sigma factor [uncultured Methylophaga sp.]|uniref:sigma-70 family RNA polymerase sigma factor n=1 Tax=uncultured Methylophaga sp. TaxID=285271 RepID=UPI00260584AE|nr:sigma-70 family RNA polymerase sigma factor [uncultured Methylophaga sp.]